LASAGLNYGRLGLRPEVALRAFGFLGPRGSAFGIGRFPSGSSSEVIADQSIRIWRWASNRGRRNGGQVYRKPAHESQATHAIWWVV